MQCILCNKHIHVKCTIDNQRGMSSTDINLMDFLFPREDAFLKGDVKDEPFIDQSYNDDAITVSFWCTLLSHFCYLAFLFFPIITYFRTSSFATPRKLVFTYEYERNYRNNWKQVSMNYSLNSFLVERLYKNNRD